MGGKCAGECRSLPLPSATANQQPRAGEVPNPGALEHAVHRHPTACLPQHSFPGSRLALAQALALTPLLIYQANLVPIPPRAQPSTPPLQLH